MKDSRNWTDKEVIKAFVRMLKTIVMWVVWLIISLYFGVEQGFAFFDDPQIKTWIHILFFAWVIIMIPLLIWVTFKKIWKVKKL